MLDDLPVELGLLPSGKMRRPDDFQCLVAMASFDESTDNIT
ncbi:MAG: hypothetical protein U5K56_07335 [Halioglobus sp.]|nr:hypothetical protein [Halioglobus sp.]